MSYEMKTPELGTIGLLRWLWRQLTSMRTALILLLLLGVASIPGSIIPNEIKIQRRFSSILRTAQPWQKFLINYHCLISTHQLGLVQFIFCYLFL